MKTLAAGTPAYDLAEANFLLNKMEYNILRA